MRAQQGLQRGRVKGTRSPPALGERIPPAFPVQRSTLDPGLRRSGLRPQEGGDRGSAPLGLRVPRRDNQGQASPFSTLGEGGRPDLAGPNVGKNSPRQGALRGRSRERVRTPVLGPVAAGGQRHDALGVLVSGRLLDRAGVRAPQGEIPSVEAGGASARRVGRVAPKGGPFVPGNIGESSTRERQARSGRLRGGGGRHDVGEGDSESEEEAVRRIPRRGAPRSPSGEDKKEGESRKGKRGSVSLNVVGLSQHVHTGRLGRAPETFVKDCK